MPSSNDLLTEKGRTLLLKVSSLLEEIIETLDILEDKDTMKSIKQAEEDIKAGRVRSYKDFLKELKNRRLQSHLHNRRATENSHTIQRKTQKNSIRMS